MSSPAARRIESASNPSVRDWRRLHKRRERERRGLCLIEGTREVSMALEAGVEFAGVILGDAAGSAEETMARAAAGHRTALYRLGDAALAKVSVRSNPAPIIAIAHTPHFSIDDLSLPSNPLVLIADSVEKPGNLGAMIRTADGAGAHAVIASDSATDLVNPNTIRASQGAVFGGPLASVPASAATRWLTTNNIVPVAATASAATPYWEADLSGPVAVVIGSEHAGVSDHWRNARQIAIPMHGRSDSLNASVAAALVLYEALRQRS